VAARKVDEVFELCGARKVGRPSGGRASSQPCPTKPGSTGVEGWKGLGLDYLVAASLLEPGPKPCVWV